MNDEFERLDDGPLDDDDFLDRQRRRDVVLKQQYVESGVTVGELEHVLTLAAGVQNHVRRLTVQIRYLATTDKTAFEELQRDIEALWNFTHSDKTS